MKILAFDTSTEAGSIALTDDGVEIFASHWQRAGSHAEVLIDKIQEALCASSLKVSDIDRLATVVGPGSFTGLRVSINAAKAFAYAFRIPVFQFPLDRALLLDETAQSDLDFVFALNAYNGLVFYSVWRRKAPGLTRQGEIELSRPEDLILPEKFLAFGPGWTDAKVAWKESYQSLPWPKNLSLQMARSCGQSPNSAGTSWSMVEPLYLRAASAEKQKGM